MMKQDQALFIVNAHKKRTGTRNPCIWILQSANIGNLRLIKNEKYFCKFVVIQCTGIFVFHFLGIFVDFCIFVLLI